MLLTVKALHIISVIAWMAGLLYLPRLFVYHADAASGGEASQMLKVMERRLLKVIMGPAMGASWIFGLGTAYMIGFSSLMADGWFHLKLLFVILLSGYHAALARYVRLFAEDKNEHPARFFRILNEVPKVIMIAIVALVIIRPF